MEQLGINLTSILLVIVGIIVALKVTKTIFKVVLLVAIVGLAIYIYTTGGGDIKALLPPSL